jgi:hypothetical protein
LTAQFLQVGDKHEHLFFAAYNMGLFIAVCFGEGIGLGLFNSPIVKTLSSLPESSPHGAKASTYITLDGGQHGVNGHTPVPGVSAIDQEVMEMPNGPCCE